jgi:hypothetical protein
MFGAYTRTVITAHIRPVTHRKEALQGKPVFLATDPDRHHTIFQGFRDRDKSLLDAETVLINRRGALLLVDRSPEVSDQRRDGFRLLDRTRVPVNLASRSFDLSFNHHRRSSAYDFAHETRCPSL